MGPVAGVLGDRGWHTVVCGVPVPVVPGDDVVDAFRAALPTDGDVVLVPHSNAGVFVPELSATARVRVAVFVDAVLPPPAGQVPLAPPAFLDLRDRADDQGLLPPWTRWWDESDVAVLFPDAASRAAVEREQQRIPLTYLEGSRPVPAGWVDGPAAYGAFGGTCATERAEAARRGWPVRTLRPAGHLHQLVDPSLVADTIGALLDEQPVAPTG